jgi:protein gp37
MGQTTIEWTATYQDGIATPGMTFNPWIGCTHVSPGCLHCYAETMMDHRYQKVEWGKGKPRIRTSEANWRKPLQWNKQAAIAGRRAKVFCSSLADVFDPEVPDGWRFDLYNLILQTPSLDWLLLTKRPEHVKNMVPGDWLLPPGSLKALPFPCGWPTNIWIGTSVEDQRRADERIPHLLNVPAAVRFLSCEPLLGPIDLGKYLVSGGISWIIAGAESGAGARPMDEQWVRSLCNQCGFFDIRFFYKQNAIKGHKQPLPELDGRQWLEMPEVSQ